MTTKTVYAVIAVIAIAIVAIGAAVLLTGGDSGIKGEYELQNGSYVTLSGDDVTTGEIKPCTVTILSDDNGIVTADWGGTPLVGERAGEYVRFSAVYKSSDGNTYREIIYAYIDNGVMRLSELVVSDDLKTTKAKYCVFAKEGAVVPNDDHTPIFKEGTVFEAFDTVYSVDSEVSDVQSTCTMKVAKDYGFAYLLEHSVKFGSMVINEKTLAIRNGTNTLLMGYGSNTGFSNIYTDGVKAQLHLNFTVGDDDIVIIQHMTSADRYEIENPSELSGKVYSGTCVSIDNNGTRYSDKATISLGDGKLGVFSMYETYGDGGCMNSATIVKDPITRGYYIAFNAEYPYDTYSEDVTVTGYITSDMSKMYLLYTSFYSDGNVGVSKSVLSLTDEVSILGTYEFRMGQEAYLDDKKNYVIGDFDISGGYGTFTIIGYDGNFATAKCGPATLVGACDGNTITFSCIFSDKGEKFKGIDTVTIIDGVLYVSGTGINKDDTMAYACVLAFVKTGLDIVLPEPGNILQKGDVYSLKAINMTVNGVSKDTEGYDMTTQVLDGGKGIYVIENSYPSYPDKTEFMLAAVCGGKSLMGVIPDSQRFTGLYVNGDALMIERSYLPDGDRVVITECMVKSENIPQMVSPELAGKIYSGTYSSFSGGSIDIKDVTIVMGETTLNHVNTNVIIGDAVYPVVFQYFAETDDGSIILRGQTQYDSSGKEYIKVYTGVLSKDLRSMTLTAANFSPDGTRYSSKAVCSLIDTDKGGIIGCYMPARVDITVGSNSWTTEPYDPFTGYVNIISVDNGVVKGSIAQTVFIGYLADGRVFTNLYVDDMYETVTMNFYDGMCEYSSVGDCPYGGYAQIIYCCKVGFTEFEEVPVYEDIFKVGDSFTAFNTISMVDGDPVESNTGQTLECVASHIGVYAFELTKYSGEKILLSGYGFEGNMIKACGFDGDNLATYKIKKHSDSYICIDREYMKDGKSCAFVYRMSPDGEPVTPSVFPDFDGKVYSGSATVYKMDGGVVSCEGTINKSVTFGKTYGSLTSAGTTAIHSMHMIKDADGKLCFADTYYKHESDGMAAYTDYTYKFSEDAKTLWQYCVATVSDGSSLVIIAEYSLQG